MSRGVKPSQLGLSLAMKNKIINGCFRLWQRNTTFSANGYTADRWYAFLGTGGSPTMTLSRQAFTLGQTDVPGEPQYYCRFNQTALASSTAPYLEQRIESVRTLAGQSASISFYAKADAARTVSADAIQNFGTTGSPSGSVTTNIGSFNLTTSWQRFTKQVTLPSISGKTLGTDNNDYLSLRFTLPLNATFTVEFDQVQLEAGGASTFEVRDIGVELRLSQRYYEKSYDIGTVPGTSTSNGIIEYCMTNTTLVLAAYVGYKTPKRAVPAITFWDRVGNISKFSQWTVPGGWVADNLASPAVSSSGESGFMLYNNATTYYMAVHYGADSEL